MITLLKKFKFLSTKINKIKKFEWGDTTSLDFSLQNASSNSYDYVEWYLNKKYDYLDSITKKIKINYRLIVKKFFFSELVYKKYFFYELVLIYTYENPKNSYTYLYERKHAGSYRSKFFLSNYIFRNKYNLLKFIVNLFNLILLIIYYRLKVTKNNIYNNKLLCFIGTKTELKAYKNILNEFDPIFITDQKPISLFKDSLSDKVIDSKIENIGLSYVNWIKIKTIIINIFKTGFIKNWTLYFDLENYFLTFFNQLFAARMLAPEGRNNTFIVFEHHDFIKTVRNEFLSADGNYSIFFSLLSGHALRKYPPEYFENYTCLISSGRMLEDIFRENMSSTIRIYRVGSYFAKYPKVEFLNSKIKRKLVNSLAGNVVITFLTPGICKPTYESEIQLLSLAKHVSNIPKVKVLIRPKIINDPVYWNFYKNQVHGYKNVILTGAEYELLEFLDFSDLFVTSYSTSSCDVALKGAPIFFVDYLNQKDRFIFFDINKNFRYLQLSKDEACDKIKSWIQNYLNNINNSEHNMLMQEFVEYLEHGQNDFFEYKKNIHKIFKSQSWRKELNGHTD